MCLVEKVLNEDKWHVAARRRGRSPRVERIQLPSQHIHRLLLVQTPLLCVHLHQQPQHLQRQLHVRFAAAPVRAHIVVQRRAQVPLDLVRGRDVPQVGPLLPEVRDQRLVELPRDPRRLPCQNQQRGQVLAADAVAGLQPVCNREEVLRVADDPELRRLVQPLLTKLAHAAAAEVTICARVPRVGGRGQQQQVLVVEQLAQYSEPLRVPCQARVEEQLFAVKLGEVGRPEIGLLYFEVIYELFDRVLAQIRHLVAEEPHGLCNVAGIDLIQ